MNIEQAKQIELRGLIEHFGGRYSKQTKPDEIWFYSPFRPNENTASFKVNPQRNVWFDFATGTGGSTIDLWLDYNNQDRKSSQSIKAALQGLEHLANLPEKLVHQYRATAKENIKQKIKEPKEANRFTLIKPPGRIWHGALLQEIARRRLSLTTVAPFLKQADILDTKTGNKLTGFAFQNDEFGWEISIPNPKAGKSFKTSVGKKAPSSFSNDAHEKALIFEGFWDYLTWVQMQKTSELKASIYVMNSLSFKKLVVNNILLETRIGKVLFFLDNDTAGNSIAQEMIADLGLSGINSGTMNHLYSNSNDLSDHWLRPL